MTTIKVEHAADFIGHRDAVYVLCKAESVSSFLSAGADGMIVRWESGSSKPGEVVARLPSAIYSLHYRIAENLLIAGTRFGSIYILDLNTKEVREQINVPGDVFRLAVSDSLMAAATAQGIYFISKNDYQILNHFQPTSKSCRVAVISEDKKYLASGWSDNFIRIYDFGSMREVYAFEAHENSVFSLAYLGNYLISGSRD